MRTAMLLMSLLCCAGLSAGNPRMYVYRNDGGFDRVELADGTELVHHIGAGRSVLVAGGTEVPLDAVDSCAVRTVDVPRRHQGERKGPRQLHMEHAQEAVQA